MKPKYRRLVWLLVALVSISVGAILILSALKDNIVFFYSPSEILEKSPSPDERVRLGGLVVEHSIKKEAMLLTFAVTDNAHTITVTYQGAVPGLFREGQGMVAEGYLRDGKFAAETLLAKHDENYMPPEVAESIKKSGHWKEKVKTKSFQP